MKTHKTNPSFKYTYPPQALCLSTNNLQCRAIQNPHLDHTTHPRTRDKLHSPQRQLHRASLRRRHRLPLGLRLHQVPRPPREDPPMGRNKAQSAQQTTTLRQRRPEDIRSLRRFANVKRPRTARQHATESRAWPKTWSVVNHPAFHLFARDRVSNNVYHAPRQHDISGVWRHGKKEHPLFFLKQRPRI